MGAAALFLPKLLSLLLIVKWGEARRLAGTAALGASILLEVVASTLLAPPRMWFHTKFVLSTLIRRSSKWNAQQRAGTGTGWNAPAAAPCWAARGSAQARRKGAS